MGFSWKMSSSLVVPLLLALAVDAELVVQMFGSDEVERYGARCLDGSPSGYFFERGTDSNKWVFYMQGGGYCHTQADCTSRSHTKLGSSKTWSKAVTPRGFSSSDEEDNPDFYSWNHVIIPYCGGDLHSGTRRDTVWGLYFAGHLTVNATVSKLQQEAALSSATHILLTGGSAGGIGTFEHADYFATLFPKAFVRATPIAGFFFPGNPLTYDDFVHQLPAQPRNSSLTDLYHARVDANCARANPQKQYLCGPANVAFLFPYINTSIFIAENQFDTNQIFTQMGCPRDHSDEVEAYVKYYGGEMRKAIRSAMVTRPNSGLYLLNCLQHSGNLGDAYHTEKVNGITYGQALADWYFQRNKLPHINYVNSTVPSQC